MLLIDFALIALLLVMVIAWWRYTDPRRNMIVVTASIAVLVVGGWAMFDYRWQAALSILVTIIALVFLFLGRLMRNSKQQKLPWITGSILGLLLIPAILLIYLFPVPDLPAPSGEHSVGVRDFELTDDSRLGIFSTDKNEPRRLLVRVWYPADSIEKIERRPYFTDEETATTANGLGSIFGAPFLFTYFKHSLTNSYVNAPLLAGANDLPVVIFSHGYTSFAGQNTALMEELASHGYLIFSVQHTYDSSPVLFPNGDVVDMDPSLIEEMRALAAGTTQEAKDAFAAATYDQRRAGKLRMRQVAIENNSRIDTKSPQVWLDDRRFVHDRLQAGNVPAHVADLVTAGVFNATGQIGMSFGGSTTGAFCMLDRRCAAAVSLDGADFHVTPFNQNIPVPFLMFYADYTILAEQMAGEKLEESHGFNDFIYERHEFAGMRNDIVRLKVNKASHFGVSDFTLFMRNPVKRVLLGDIDSQDMIQIQNDFVRGFFDTHLRNINVNFPEAQFTQHNEWVERNDINAVRKWWLAQHPEDISVKVVLETTQGDVEVAVYPERTSAQVADFLNDVDKGYFDGTSFSSAVTNDESNRENLLENILLKSNNSVEGEHSTMRFALPSIGAERLNNPEEYAVITYFSSRNSTQVGSADGERMSMVDDRIFGRVLKGIRILEAIQENQAIQESRVIGQENAVAGSIASEDSDNPVAKERIMITRAYRAS